MIGFYPSAMDPEAVRLAGPLLVQEFVYHGEAMLKVYVLGEDIFVDTRTSISSGLWCFFFFAALS